MYKNHTISAIINCAGISARFGSNKLTQVLTTAHHQPQTIIATTVRAFVMDEIDEIIVTVSAKYRAEYETILLQELKLPVKLVLGGAERYLSALNGLKAAQGDVVLIHDGVRPFIRPAKIKELLSVLDRGAQAAILASKAVTTIKKVNPTTKVITDSLRREESYLAQTPQLFNRKLLLDIYQEALDKGYQIVSDDSELISQFSSEPVYIVDGDEDNIKITYRSDLAIARAVSSAWQAEK
ncbi:2-C-methyl-D-erythritol 4-phosphate cytidylyltransferase [Microgenomates group bacterium]|nr:2-C-methyl-D-erythritol 4-phosphate cytidylyltransferase [Microgenomates group bacterium]